MPSRVSVLSTSLLSSEIPVGLALITCRLTFAHDRKRFRISGSLDVLKYVLALLEMGPSEVVEHLEGREFLSVVQVPQS